MKVMEKKRGKAARYWKQYKWSNIFAMMRNNRADPAICSDTFQERLMVITGGTSGIGYSACRKYASHGAKILSINRNKDKSEKLCEELRRDFGIDCAYRIADLSRLEDIIRVGKELAAMEETIDVFIHNAGVYLTRKRLSFDGLEMTFIVNYLSSFIMNYLIKDKLKAQGKARVLMVNSEGHRFAVWGVRLDDLNWQKRLYTGLRSYGSAKTAQLLSMLLFDKYFGDCGVTINAMHPGAVKTSTGKENGRFYNRFKAAIVDTFSRSPDISAEALYYLGVSKDVEGMSGRFFNLTREEQPAPPALDVEVAEELWSESLRMGGLNNASL